MNGRLSSLYVAAVALTALVPLAACQPADTQGAVTARIHHGKWRYLVVRQADGQTVKFRVGLFSGAWRHCRVGEPYPACAGWAHQNRQALPKGINMRNVTTIDTPATNVTIGQILAEVDGERLHRSRLRQWLCRRKNRQLINGYPVVTRVDYRADGEGGHPTVYVESSEMPGWTWCLKPSDVVKIVA